MLFIDTLMVTRSNFRIFTGLTYVGPFHRFKNLGDIFHWGFYRMEFDRATDSDVLEDLRVLPILEDSGIRHIVMK